MSDLISRQALREAMYEEAMVKDSDEQRWDGGCWIRYKMFERVIDAMPTIDAVPVQRGKWIHGREVSRDYVGDACVCIHYEKWWCSECNYTVDLGEPLWHYCPNCGAKMDGGKDDAE